MTSYLTDAQKTAIKSAFTNMHDTFKRDITVYSDVEQTLVSIDGDFDSFYGRGPSAPSTPSVTPTVVSARVKYFSPQEAVSENLNAKLGDVFPQGLLRLKVDSDGWKLLRDSKRVVVDSVPYEQVNDPSRIGPFEPVYFTVYLKRVD